MKRKVCNRCGKLIDMGSRCSCKPAIETKPFKNEDDTKDNLIHTAKWKKKRIQILKRDNFLCQRCLIKYNVLNSEELTVHHIKSRKNYPELTFDDENLMCLCGTCNKQLGTKDKLDFEWSKNIEYKEYNL